MPGYLISVIVPVYKSEKYLPQCIESILSQTFSDFELILVDDGSPDNAGKICDEYAKKDSRIRVFHKDNKGAGAARNFGLSIAKGSLIMFVDSDDYIDTNMLYDLLSVYSSTKANIVASYFKYLDRNRQIKEAEHSKGPITLSGEEALKSLFRRKFDCSPCMKIYEKKVLGRFPEGVVNEDFVFLYKTYQNCNKIIYLPFSYYYYRYNPQSVTHSTSSSVVNQFNNMLYIEGDLINIKYDLWDDFNNYKCKSAMDCCFWILFRKIKVKYHETYQQARSICKQNFAQILFGTDYSFRYKIKLLIALFIR